MNEILEEVYKIRKRKNIKQNKKNEK